MSYIIDIGTAVPPHSLSQIQFCDVYSSMTHDVDEKRKIKFLTAKSDINKRNCVEPDIRKLVDLDIAQKLAIFHRNAVDLAIKAIENNSAFTRSRSKITDIICISCTGMQAPGIEIDLMNHFNLSTKIRRYNVNFMGCYASITGLRMAKDICATPGRTVLLVSVELCTLHFQHAFSDDYLLSNSLFADGAASAIISSESTSNSLHLDDFESRLIPETSDEMSWKISANGFLMSLSSAVPRSIQNSLQAQNLFGLDPQKVDWAIHPGGKQIVDGVKSILHLTESDIVASRKILLENGNMSSATILFVLNEMMNRKTADRHQLIACAFGPGLTLESALLSYV